MTETAADRLSRELQLARDWLLKRRPGAARRVAEETSPVAGAKKMRRPKRRRPTMTVKEKRARHAAFESRCSCCNLAILEGDTLALLEPGGEWVHEECAEETPWEDDE